MVLVMYDPHYGSVMVKVSAKHIHIYGKHVIAMISDCEHNRNVLLCQEGSMDPSIAGQDPLQNRLRSASQCLDRNEVLWTVPITSLGILDVLPTFLMQTVCHRRLKSSI